MKNKSKKERTAEPSGRTSHQLQDKGYKKLFANKEMFLEFLQTFVNEEWVRDINEEDLVRIDKEFVLQDYRKKEADIVYKMKFKNPEMEEAREVIFYILMELQSSVDRMMPYRLLMYMVQIWKQELTNVKYDEAQDKDYKLPAIVPIVLYNGAKEWDAVKEFKKLLNEPDRFGDYLGNGEALYYKFHVKEWKALNPGIKPKELRISSRLYTNLFLLLNAKYIPELCIKSKEEYRLYMELKRQSDGINIRVSQGEDDWWYSNIEFEGGRVVVEDQLIKVYKGERYYEYMLEEFGTKPRTVITLIKRFFKNYDLP